jgi:two-component system, OmpR family, sensor histidine kinase KdpD
MLHPTRAGQATTMKSDQLKWRALTMRIAGAAHEPRMLRLAWPLLVALFAILVTSAALLAVDRFLDAKSLIFVYLLPTVVMAIHYGSTVAVLTSFVSGLAAAYFFFPPKFSFYIADPLNVAELGFFLLLAVIASKAVAVVTEDARAIERRTPD